MHLTPVEVLLIPSPFYLGLGIWAVVSVWRADRQDKRDAARMKEAVKDALSEKDDKE